MNFPNRIKGEKANNLEIAIACYGEALKIRTPTAFSINYIETSFNLGLAYQEAELFQDAENTFAPAIDVVESRVYRT